MVKVNFHIIRNCFLWKGFAPSVCLIIYLFIYCYLFISMNFTSYYCFITFLLKLFKTCLQCVLAMFISFYVCLNCRGGS